MHRSVVRIQRIDDEKHVVFGEVYAPNIVDTYGEFMLPQDVEIMCHRFAQLILSESIDTNHDNVPNGSYPVESFIARESDPDFVHGAWVLGIKVPDDHLFAQIKKGELNGFSFEALVRPVAVRAKVATVRDQVGLTEPGGANRHTHLFFVEVNDFGRVVRGFTSVVDEHSHDIRSGSMTKSGGDDGHTHRFFL